MKFVASFSGGKDSVLALHKAILEGHEPIALITTFNEEKDGTWFHNLSLDLLNNMSASLNIPLEVIKTNGENYEKDFEKTLKKYKEKSVEMCVFGDIDILDHYNWCNNRCLNVGMKSFFPLWNEDRKELVLKFINLGYKTIITVINTDMMNEKYLGEILTLELMKKLESENIDVCGENGEYHTFVIGGPLFKQNMNFKKGEVHKEKNKVFLPILKS